MIDRREVLTIVGAGLAGTLLAVLLAQRGFKVHLLERRGDPRKVPVERGRSINLALAARGLNALELAGLNDKVTPLLIPMRGRMLHDLAGNQTFVRYGQRPNEVIYSVSRGALNELLLDAAEAQPNLKLTFDAHITDAAFNTDGVLLKANSLEFSATHLIAADGAGSVLRRALVEHTGTACDIDMLAHGYKELTMPPSAGQHAIDPNALHIWPRGGYMLIALPNLDGSFTVTLFLAREGSPSFADLKDNNALQTFFQREFADAVRLMPALNEEFMSHPTGEMGTVRCHKWALENRMLLIGDAAHAIVPFHGQGMNCALEDCARLVALLETSATLQSAFAAFEQERMPQANAIADMALENYVEMRDTVRDPKFLLQRELSLELERRFPDRFVPRYSMVMFHAEIPYAVARERGRTQAEILHALTANAESLAHIDYRDAAVLIIERLPALPHLSR